jgi:serine/threonine protein kinase
MIPNDRSLWVGRVIEQYQIMSLIAAGGMGVVYLARDRRLGRHVALKSCLKSSQKIMNVSFDWNVKRGCWHR